MCPSLAGEWPGLESELERIEQAGLYRQRQVIESAQGPEILHKGRRLLNFCSNDYLGLANHPALCAAATRTIETYGLGSGASQLVCGRSRMHEALEEALAGFTGRDRALVFSTGYMANLAVVSTLCPGRRALVIEDRLNHASMIDGALLSQGVLRRYRHVDPGALKTVLEQREAEHKLVLTDAVFSMDGDIAPLDELSVVCREGAADLVVDDAHGIGVLGATGRGTLEHFGLDQSRVPVLVGTFGKSLGAFGAFVAGPASLIEFLIQKARPYIYTTALPAAICAAVETALGLIDDESWRREHLRKNIALFRQGAEQLCLPVAGSQTPIQPLLIGDAEEAVALSQSLFVDGILITAIRPPTVPRGGSRLRITLSAAHSAGQIEQLLEALDRHCRARALKTG